MKVKCFWYDTSLTRSIKFFFVYSVGSNSSLAHGHVEFDVKNSMDVSLEWAKIEHAKEVSVCLCTTLLCVMIHNSVC